MMRAMDTKIEEKDMNIVKIDEYGLTYCGACGQVLECDENGDMPEICPKCRMALNWEEFDSCN